MSTAPETYIIKECHGKTTIGSMLVQTLQAQHSAILVQAEIPEVRPGVLAAAV